MELIFQISYEFRIGMYVENFYWQPFYSQIQMKCYTNI